MTSESTHLALRATAFVSSLLFAWAFAARNRKAWWGFVVSHSIHLGFILWLAFGLREIAGDVTDLVGASAYATIYVLSVADARKPGAAVHGGRLARAGLYFVALNLVGTYALLFTKHGIRPLSVIGCWIVLISFAIRLRNSRIERPISSPS